MIKANIIGAGGYGGVGILELLLRHPEAEVGVLIDIENAGRPIADLFPHLAGYCNMLIVDAADEEAHKPADIVFMATPDGVGMKLAGKHLETGARIIDFSGDFRFTSPRSYADYATRIGAPAEHAAPDLLAEAVYGLAELHRKELTTSTRIVGNPGCFAVSCIMGLAPAVKKKLVKTDGIICDCKTGVSGAGKKPGAQFHYPARYDHMNAYKLAGHQHVCEIEEQLGLMADTSLNITFTAQVVPVCRGIMSTLYAPLANDLSERDAVQEYRDFFKQDTFVRVYESDSAVGSVHVRGTNYCNLVVSIDSKTRMLRVVSYIDNLVKGQAGSAMQNMNLISGLPENAGLDIPGIYP
jgi:N-acetyl-gamma-glutamyl-phosphate reductase